MPSGSPVLLLLALATCAPAGRPMISEILYDALGGDEGLEFVELYNPTPQPADITGLRLESGDGAGPGRWTLRWTAPAGTSIEGGGRWLIGGARVTPAPAAIVELGLQNGPDAVRLVWPDGAVEAVGYGPLAEAEYSCGRPAADVASGQSLARIPDASDRGENALDFTAATPSPGRANRPARHAAWVAGSLAIEPRNASPGETVHLSGLALNAGSDTLAAGEVVLRALLRRDDGLDERGRFDGIGSLVPGETLGVAVEAPAPENGVHTWVAVLSLVGDEYPEAARDSVRARVGPGPLSITEIQFHPARGEGEWVEVENRPDSTVGLAGYALRDRSGTRGIPLSDSRCPPESLALLAQDPVRLLAVYPRVDPARVVALHPWPSLNNADDAAGVADVLELRDAEDLTSDRVSYSAAGIPAGIPIERGPDGRWRAARDPAGSPLARLPAPAPIRGTFAIDRPRLRAGATTARIQWSLPWASALIKVDAYDLSGARIAALLPETDVAGRGESDLGVASLGPGLAVLVLTARSRSQGETLRASRLLRIAGPAR